MTRRRNFDYEKHHKDIADMKKSGMDLKEIAKNKGYKSTGSVSYILKTYFPDLSYPKNKPGVKPNPTTRKEVRCKCGKLIKTYKKSPNLRTYCSWKCYLKYNDKRTINFKGMTKEQKRAYNRKVYMKNYKPKNKNK